MEPLEVFVDEGEVEGSEIGEHSFEPGDLDVLDMHDEERLLSQVYQAVLRRLKEAGGFVWRACKAHLFNGNLELEAVL